MEPSDAVNTLERVLRDLVRLVLGESWLDSSGLDRTKLEDRWREESKSRDGAVVPRELLTYTHLYELRRVIDRNWDDFKPALQDKKRFGVYLDRIEDFRNAPMHSRELLTFERELLSGMVGEVRNQVSLFRSQPGRDRRFYPTVDSLVDSFGVPAVSVAQSNLGTTTGLRVQVGDTVTFQARATDPQGRNLTWTVVTLTPLGMRDAAVANGADVMLAWTFDERDVSESCNVRITMASEGPHHREGDFDFNHTFIYALEPPVP